METTQSIQEFNRRAMECSNHRMIIISTEMVYKSKYDQGNGINDTGMAVTCKCNGSCQQSTVQEFKN